MIIYFTHPKDYQPKTCKNYYNNVITKAQFETTNTHLTQGF